MDPMHSQTSFITTDRKHCVILTEYYRVDPEMAAKICGNPDSTALTVKPLTHLSRFGSIFNSDAIETILNMP